MVQRIERGLKASPKNPHYRQKTWISVKTYKRGQNGDTKKASTGTKRGQYGDKTGTLSPNLCGFLRGLNQSKSVIHNIQTKKIPCKSLIYKGFSIFTGGAGGIRTPGGFNSPHAFQACDLNHSSTAPQAHDSNCAMLSFHPSCPASKQKSRPEAALHWQRS